MKISDADFIRLRDFMYKKFGINLAEKRVLIEGRLTSVLNKRGYTDFGPYIDDVMKDTTGKELSLLVSKLTTNFTYFLREEGHYEFLKKNVLPAWKQKAAGRRIWSAACSSGEEPYSLAMVLTDFLGPMVAPQIKIDASDISENVMEQAKAGVYNMDKISKLPKGWVPRFFDKNGTDYAVKQSLKSMINYRYFNLNDLINWPTGAYDVIFCRNVMIYFDQPTRQALSKRLYNALKPGGYLIIGMSETLVNLSTGFKYVQPSIYQREAPTMASLQK